jgi:hypothetical protein
VLAHHERWDGGGYPRGLRGEDIPLNARIVAVVDTFDAITHSRRYHAGQGVDRGVAAIREGRGTQFDPRIVDVFLSESVQGDVGRTFEASNTEVRWQPRRAPKSDRRAAPAGAAAESSGPDVRFRWRERSAVAPTGIVPNRAAPRPDEGSPPA